MRQYIKHKVPEAITVFFFSVSVLSLFLIGIYALLTWHFKGTCLIQFPSKCPNIEYHTGVCFLLFGLGFLCLQLRKWNAGSVLFGAIIIVLSALSLFDSMLGVNLERQAEGISVLMASNTAVYSLLGAIALILMVAHTMLGQRVVVFISCIGSFFIFIAAMYF